MVYRTKPYDAERKYLPPHNSLIVESASVQPTQSRRCKPETGVPASGSLKDASAEDSGTKRVANEKCRFSPEKIKRLYSGLWALRKSFDRHGAGLEDDLFSVKSENITRTCAKVQPMPRSMQPHQAGSSQTVAAVSPVISGRARQRKNKTGVYRQSQLSKGGQYEDKPSQPDPSPNSYPSTCPWYEGRIGDELKENGVSNILQSGSRADRIQQPETNQKQTISGSVFKTFGWHGLDYHIRRKCNNNQLEVSNAVEKPRAIVDNAAQPARGAESSKPTDRKEACKRQSNFNERCRPLHHNGSSCASAENLERHSVRDSSFVRQPALNTASTTLSNVNSVPLSMPSFLFNRKPRSFRKKHSCLFLSEGSDNSSSDTNMTFYHQTEKQFDKDRRWRAWINRVRPRVGVPISSIRDSAAYSHQRGEDTTSTCTSDNDVITSLSGRSKLVGRVQGHRAPTQSANSCRSGSSGTRSGRISGLHKSDGSERLVPVSDVLSPERNAFCNMSAHRLDVSSGTARDWSCSDERTRDISIRDRNKRNDFGASQKYERKTNYSEDVIDVEEANPEGGRPPVSRLCYSGSGDGIPSSRCITDGIWYKP